MKIQSLSTTIALLASFALTIEARADRTDFVYSSSSSRTSKRVSVGTRILNFFRGGTKARAKVCENKPESSLGETQALTAAPKADRKPAATASNAKPKAPPAVKPYVAPVVSQPGNMNWLACHDGIASGTEKNQALSYTKETRSKYGGRVTSTEKASVQGVVHTGPYIPHAGAVNMSMLNNSEDRQYSMKNSPVETLGTLTEAFGKSFVAGNMSTFGGEHDKEYTEKDEGVAGEGDRSRVRDLNSAGERYCTMRFDYSQMPQGFLKHKKFIVFNPRTGLASICRRRDWGPNKSTGRVMDMSERMARDIGAGDNNNEHQPIFIAFAKNDAVDGPIAAGSCGGKKVANNN